MAAVVWRAGVVLVAVALLVVPLPTSLGEQYYSSGVYPALQSVLTRASNQTAVAWFDVLIVVAGAWLAAASVRDLRTRRWWLATGTILMRALTIASVLFLLFTITWGLNYQRASLRRKVPFEPERVTPENALRLAHETASQANALYGPAHAHGFPRAGEIDPELASSFASTSRALGLSPQPVAGRPKRTLLDLYFRRAGVAGMTDPFFLETLVASDILPFERPHVVAHEWAHLAGVTDEGEANFVGWLACVRGTVAHRYSGWLFLYAEVMAALPRDDARDVARSLGSGPRADLQAIRERTAREISPRLSRAGWQVYDQYLRANRIEAGTASYAEVVQLVLGTGMR
jgi:hypothetical protein